MCIKNQFAYNFQGHPNPRRCPFFNDNGYGETKSHNHVKSNHQKDVYMVFRADNKVCLSLTYQNKQVKVTLEFPERSDRKSEQEFISRLKAVYLEKANAAKDKEETNIE